MTFDNAAELDKIAEVYPDAELVIRIKVDDSGSLMQFSSKFGADLDAVPDLLEHAADLGLNVIGVSFHVGSGCCDPSSFQDAIINARWVFDQAAEYGYEFTLLDLGGGFPGDSGSEGLFDECARAINKQLDESFAEEDGRRLEIIAEPGRFMAASAFTLYTTVIAKRRVHDNTFMYYLNDGVYGSFNCTVFDHHQPEPVAIGKADTEKSYTSVLWGPTCDSMDKIHPGVQLPEMAVGEWLVFRNMGAYTCSAASPFNGFAKPTLHYVVNPTAEVILSGSVIGQELLRSLDQGKRFLEELVNKIHANPAAVARLLDVGAAAGGLVAGDKKLF